MSVFFSPNIRNVYLEFTLVALLMCMNTWEKCFWRNHNECVNRTECVTQSALVCAWAKFSLSSDASISKREVVFFFYYRNIGQCRMTGFKKHNMIHLASIWVPFWWSAMHIFVIRLYLELSLLSLSPVFFLSSHHTPETIGVTVKVQSAEVLFL